MLIYCPFAILHHSTVNSPEEERSTDSHSTKRLHELDESGDYDSLFDVTATQNLIGQRWIKAIVIYKQKFREQKGVHVGGRTKQ